MKQLLLLAVQKFKFPANHYLSKKTGPHSFYFRRFVGWLLTGVMVLFTVAGAWAQQDILAGLTSGGGLQGAGTAFIMKSDGTGFTVRKNFVVSGQTPSGDLIQATDGNFYGMTTLGGTYGEGTIFKMSSAGTITYLHNFNAATEGGRPNGSLVQGSDSNFYGIASRGGLYGSGTIFKITPNGILTVLHHLIYISDGNYPTGSLVQGADGNFYGLTLQGGSYFTKSFSGTIFRITSTGTFTVLKNLGEAKDGGSPSGSLVQGKDGNLYGMNNQGGTFGHGTIFRITPDGNYSVRRHLNSVTDGDLPNGNSLTAGSDGNLYGMIASGGTYGSGTFFKLTLGGTFTVLRNLESSTNGSRPTGRLYQNTDGTFYGMTQEGGTFGFGTIFRITPTGNLTVLRHLNNTQDGGAPQGSLVKSTDGSFYGMTTQGGVNHLGTIFKITPFGTFNVLVQLPESTGAYPMGNLIQARNGSYYGMTSQGGSNNKGSIFKLCGNTFTTILSFDAATSGANPQGGLVQGTNGNFYGMANNGGAYGFGTIFRMTSSGTLTVLWNFDGTIEGAYPNGNLVQGADGNFYGMTYQGGTYNNGTIFRITPVGILTVLKNLNSTDGSYPIGSLVQGSDGNFYGMTSRGGPYGDGTIFKVTPTGSVTILHSLDYYTNGAFPQGGLVQGSDDNFYGMTQRGGTYGYGTIFRITPTGTLTVVRHLATNDGIIPIGSLVSSSSGVFYGMTSEGGTYGGGTIFKITPDGTFTILRHLSPATDGYAPQGSLAVQKSNPIANAQNVTTTVNIPKVIILTGSGGAPLIFKIAGQPQHGTLTGSNANRIYTPNPGFTGTDSFNFRVIWGCQSSTSKTVTINVGTASTVRINTGGSVVATSLGRFSADNYFSGTTSVSTTVATIANTTNDVLYQDHRRAISAGGSFRYNIPVSNGSYTVKLHFAETFYNTTGKRKFNVIVEGNSWLTNYDIYTAAGGAKRAIVATKTINVSDGTLNLNFISKVDKACVSAIEVVPVAGAERLAVEEEQEEESALAASLYPNPVKTLLTVQLSGAADDLQTSVWDATGAKVLHNPHQVVSSDKLQINVASLPAGLYLLQVETYQGRQTFKFMKE